MFRSFDHDQWGGEEASDLCHCMGAGGQYDETARGPLREQMKDDIE